jgi:hypothetical protein
MKFLPILFPAFSLLAARADSSSVIANIMLDASRVRLLDGPFKQRQESHRAGRLGAFEVDCLLFPYRTAVLKLETL